MYMSLSCLCHVMRLKEVCIETCHLNDHRSWRVL